MSERHSESARRPLQNAAEVYDSIVNQLEQMDTSKDQLATADGRQRLISLIRAITPLESEAQERMAEAANAIRGLIGNAQCDRRVQQAAASGCFGPPAPPENSVLVAPQGLTRVAGLGLALA